MICASEYSVLYSVYFEHEHTCSDYVLSCLILAHMLDKMLYELTITTSLAAKDVKCLSLSSS